MTGEHKVMASMVCAKVHKSRDEAVEMHCIICQGALCAKTIQLGDVMNTVVKHNLSTRAPSLSQLAPVTPIHLCEGFFIIRVIIDSRAASA